MHLLALLLLLPISSDQPQKYPIDSLLATQWGWQHDTVDVPPRVLLYVADDQNLG